MESKFVFQRTRIWNDLFIRQVIDNKDIRESLSVSILSIDMIREFKDKIVWEWQWYDLKDMWKHRKDKGVEHYNYIMKFWKEFRNEIEICEQSFGALIV